MTRTAGQLGEGLAGVRPARAIRPGERIHILGIAGAGASAAALHAHAAGAIVSGCDPGGPSPYTTAVEGAGIPIAWTHAAAHVAIDPAPDRLAVTKALTAVDPHNPELEAASARGIAIEGWQQLVADAAFGRTLVAVAGTHGKSTTAGWLTWALAEGGLDPSAFVGALLPESLTGSLPATARIGQGSAFIVEADEYAGNFDAYRPDVVLLTSIEWDHPDVFANRAAVLDAFEAWHRRVPEATIVGNAGDRGVHDALRRIGTRPGRIVRVVANADRSITGDVVADIIDEDPSGTAIRYLGIKLGWLTIRLPTAGRQNVANAAVVAAAAEVLGMNAAGVSHGLATFPGIGRRLERKGEARGVVVYDDYGHHPTAIRATLAAVRQREPGRRVWAVYEPLTFHRTAAMLDEFAAALAIADAVAVSDIWASRDPDTSITSAEALAAAVRTIRPDRVAAAPGSVEATATWLAANVEDGDAVLVMGGGKSYRIAELLLEHLESS